MMDRRWPSPSSFDKCSWDSDSSLTSKSPVSHLGYNSDKRNEDGYLKEGPEKLVVPPDWSALLFGVYDKDCTPVLTRTDYSVDTYHVDCKLAEDNAINFISKYDIPIFNSARDCNVTQVSRALKSMKKINQHVKTTRKYAKKKEVLVYVILFDYLTCCCQEGNLISLYKKSKALKKREQISSIENGLAEILYYLKDSRWSSVEISSIKRLIDAAIKRIPNSLHLSSYVLKQSLSRKISSIEKCELMKKDKSVYNFEEDLTLSRMSCNSSLITTSSPHFIDDLFSTTKPHHTEISKASTPKKKHTPAPPEQASTSKAHHNADRKFLSNLQNESNCVDFKHISSLDYESDDDLPDVPIDFNEYTSRKSSLISKKEEQRSEQSFHKSPSKELKQLESLNRLKENSQTFKDKNEKKLKQSNLLMMKHFPLKFNKNSK